MSTPNVDQPINEALEGTSFQLVSSDGAAGSIQQNQLLTDSLKNGWSVKGEQASGTSASFNRNATEYAALSAAQPAPDLPSAPSMQPITPKVDDLAYS